MDLTYRQLLTASAALNQLAALASPFASRVRIARIKRVVDSAVQDFTDARKALVSQHAEHDAAGGAIGERGAQGATYKLSATAELTVANAVEEVLRSTITIDAAALTMNDFPAKVGTADNPVTADILAGLGPLLDLPPG